MTTDGHELTIRISDSDLRLVVDILNGQGHETEVCAEFAQLSVQHAIDWISGRRRYGSLTEQHADWIEDLFDSFFPNEAPRAQRLYNNFNLPYGQAQYLARVLNDRSQPRFRARARAELRPGLEALREAAQRSVDAGDLSNPQSMTITNSARLELIRMCEELFAGDTSFKWPRGKGGFGDMRQVELESQTVLQLLARL